MDAGAWNPRRWRAFADGVAAALGLNVWISLLLLPGLFVGAFTSAWSVLGALISLAVLGLGLYRRSEVLLLLGFPSALLLPVAYAPELATVHVYGPIRFAVVAAGLVAYLFGASVFTFFHEPRPPVGTRPLSSATQPVPARWKRRFRVYRGLTLLSAVFPLVFLYFINFDDANQAFLRGKYPGRVAAMSTIMNAAALGVWVLLFFTVFLGVLRPHRTGDRDLIADLGLLRSLSRRPRPVFYVGVFAALALMLVLILLRYY